VADLDCMRILNEEMFVVTLASLTHFMSCFAKNLSRNLQGPPVDRLKLSESPENLARYSPEDCLTYR